MPFRQMTTSVRSFPFPLCILAFMLLTSHSVTTLPGVSCMYICSNFLLTSRSETTLPGVSCMYICSNFLLTSRSETTLPVVSCKFVLLLLSFSLPVAILLVFRFDSSLDGVFALCRNLQLRYMLEDCWFRFRL